VLDLLPYDQRGLYGIPGAPVVSERFGPERWICRDICDRAPFPFADGAIDFVVCSHTLEDVRDPIWVCAEMNRIARAGYIETPSRLEEQSWGVQGPWVGWSHHRWLVDVTGHRLEFAFKHHLVCARPTDRFPAGFWAALIPEERVLSFEWSGGFDYCERTFDGAADLDAYLADFVQAELARRPLPPGPSPALPRRLWRRARRAVGHSGR